ncbi:Arc family DNA-binding protein [Agrobacterium pusense]|uniref:Arc family DNA-binding protein n=1 Tax=Agrobacterium pusense TaxID=648995 RepID=UPI00289741B9|nr:Arc family DNA-binding protein [Agrobacterium pusense]
MKTGRDSDQFPLRLPEGMRDKIRCEADSNNRSMNAEIVFQLSRAYAQSEMQKAHATA